MPGSDLPVNITPLTPLLSGSPSFASAAETMLAASRTMLAAASALSAGAAGIRGQELTAEAVEAGFVRALRRESLLGGGEAASAGGSSWGLPGGSIPGTGYGRTGASLTGHGARAQTYGAIGGAIGYAVGGPIGGLLGGMLGGLLGDDDDDARRKEELRRQWLNDPEGFEIEAYLYHLARAGGTAPRGSLFSSSMPLLPAWPLPRWSGSSVVVQLAPGAVQITGQGEEAGESAARAFAGALGRALELNRVVVPAAGWGGIA
jgi:hypothetical protein